ncbi:MAG TPA: glucosamine-6-phosphate deaminase [Planctomycetota bacterium]
MQLLRLPDPHSVASRAADLVQETLRARPDATLLLPAGATPVPLYAELVRRARAGALDLGPTRLFQLDELVGVPPTDRRSFHAFFVEHLIAPLGLARAFHGLDGAARDPATEIERHRRALAACGPAELVLLGLGRNGHVAFNEPGSLVTDAARVVELAATTRQGLSHPFPQDTPTRGITLGLAEIAAGRRLVVLVTGSAKRERLGELLEGRARRDNPATLLADHPALSVLADRAALEPATAAGS